LEADYTHIHNYLVERCLQNDPKAQKELYRLYFGAMYSLCRRMMGDDEEAKDALQEAFIIAFTKLHTFKFEASFGAWLKRIVINKCIGILQQKRLLTSPINENFDVEEYKETNNEEEIKYEIQKVKKALDNISDGCKVVMNLYLFEGYDHKEIAEILGITESTSKAQYHKGKKKLLKQLEMDK